MSDTLKTWSIEKVTRLISSLLKKNQGTANAGKFMKVGNDGNLVPDIIPDPTNKADKVTNATTGNFAGLDATGNLTDSGKSAEDFAGAIYKTATPGSIVTIDDGADDLPIKELKVGIEPVQDLHEYDHPWPAGGGVNKLKLKALSSSVTNGVTVTTDPLSGKVTVSGTASEETTITLSENVVMGENETFWLKLFSVSNDVADSVAKVRMTGFEWITIANNGMAGFQVGYSFSTSFVIKVFSGQTINVSFYPEYSRTSAVEETFTPYSNICPITGWTGAKVSRTGKNLLNIAESEMVSSGYNRYFPLRLKAGTYTMSCQNRLAISGAGSSCQVSIVNSNRGQIKAISLNYGYSNSYKSFSFTITDSEANQMAYLVFEPIVIGATFSDIELMQNMIELGSTATAYEPYQGETYDITFPSEAGTVYGGTLDVTNGVLTVDRVSVDLGALHWSYYSDSSTEFFTTNSLSTLIKSTGNNDRMNGYCSVFDIRALWGDNFSSLDCVIAATGTNLRARWLAYTNASEFIAAVTGQILVYPLATPITYTLTPQEIRTLLGVNNIWADTGDITELIYPVNTDTAMALYEKADKVANATAGNLAALDAEGNLKDSGKKPSDFLTQDQGATNAGKFMKVGADGKLVPDTIPDPTGKADKVSGATNGNFAGLDANGNLMDSGKSTDDFLDKNYESGWKPKTLSGLANIDALYVWTDGENIYYSKYGSHYVLDKTTFEWTRKVWNGYTDFSGKCIWSDGENIYYSSGGTTIVLDKSTSTWSIKYWNNFTYSLDGDYIWTDGENYYYSRGTAQYVLDKANDTWVTKTWNGLTNFDGVLVWTDGNDIYHTAGTTYVLDKATSTWSVKTWSGMAGFGGSGVWSDGENVYYNSTKVLDRDSSTWEDKSWNGLDEFYSENLWTDRENIYCSRNNSNYILDNNPKLYLGQDGEFAPVSVKKFIDDNVPAYSFAYDTVDSALVITIPN